MTSLMCANCTHSMFECHNETGCHWQQHGAVRGCSCTIPFNRQIPCGEDVRPQESEHALLGGYEIAPEHRDYTLATSPSTDSRSDWKDEINRLRRALEDMLNNETCSCLRLGQHPCARCKISIDEARIDLQTEREMHNAWRKRAEEAEAELQRMVRPRLTAAELDSAMWMLFLDGSMSREQVCQKILDRLNAILDSKAHA